MDTLIPTPTTGELHLLLAPQSAGRRLMSELTARLVLRGELRVLDGGNCFDLYGIARQVRRCSPALHAALERLQIARAFTCYQMGALLAGQENDSRPLLVMEPLTTFYDENVPQAERHRLLTGCLGELRRLARTAPVVFSAAPPGAGEDPFLLRLSAAAQQVWWFDALPSGEAHGQLRLF